MGRHGSRSCRTRTQHAHLFWASYARPKSMGIATSEHLNKHAVVLTSYQGASELVTTTSLPNMMHCILVMWFKYFRCCIGAADLGLSDEYGLISLSRQALLIDAS